MKKILFLLCIYTSGFGESTKFLNKIYGQIHQSPIRTSRVLTTFECAHPLKFKAAEGDFSLVTYANYSGYILSSHLSDSKPRDCYQDSYRKFFEIMELGISEMHYLGKLQDSFVEGRVMP